MKRSDSHLEELRVDCCIQLNSTSKPTKKVEQKNELLVTITGTEWSETSML